MEVSHYKMAANNITNLYEKFSHEVEMKKKNFRWTVGMIENLINCLADYKAKMEYQSLGFDADRPQQIKEVGMEMARNMKMVSSVQSPSPFRKNHLLSCLWMKRRFLQK